MFFRKIVILIWIFTRLLVPLAAPKVLPFERKNKKLLFLFCCTRIEAQMAESVDALVSNTSGATRAGSTPALGTRLERSVLTIN